MVVDPNTPVLQTQSHPSLPPTRAELHVSIPSPRSLAEHLDRRVIGQARAKRKLAVAVANHFRRLADEDRREGRATGPDPLADSPELAQVAIERSNVLMIGPSGSGKTLLVKVLAEMLDVPVVVGDATTLTEAGYAGADVEGLLTRLFLAAHGDVLRAQRGIVFLDEVDKLRRCPGGSGTHRDASGEGVQQALLKMLEGCACYVSTQLGPRHPEAQVVPFDTGHVLFICGGAFPGLEDVVSRRLGRDARRFGFGGSSVTTPEDDHDLLRYAMPCDLEEYGMIPELVGRLPVVAALDALGEEDLVCILTEPRDALLKQFRKLLRLSHGADLEFTDDAIREIARLAHEMGVGARGLRAVIEDVLEGILFDACEGDRGTCFVIDERVVRGDRAPVRKAMRATPPLHRTLSKRRATC